MSNHITCPIQKTEFGFKKFIKYTLFEANAVIKDFNSSYSFLVNPAEYAFAERIVELYRKVEMQFSEDELNSIEYLKYHNRLTAIPENYVQSIRTAYRKWYKVFFPRGRHAAYRKIDYKYLGRMLKAIRKQHDLSKEAFARIACTSKRTIENYENGVFPPSLDFLCYIKQTLNISIDDLIDKSSK